MAGEAEGQSCFEKVTLAFLCCCEGMGGLNRAAQWRYRRQ